MRILFYCILASISVALFSRCEGNNWNNVIPYAYVDTTINLTNQQYLPLQTDRGFVDILSGYRGIIIYRQNATTYKAFEKASPHRVDEACAEVFVDPSGLWMREGCDNTIYDFDGNPVDGVTPLPLRQYNTQLDGIYLHIFSE